MQYFQWSAHCFLVPYWAERLKKNILKAKQVSARGGDLLCEYVEDRVLLSAKAVLYSQGIISFLTLKQRKIDVD
jgi:predicted PhzF superfamily epimerase YddE/YHI9